LLLSPFEPKVFLGKGVPKERAFPFRFQNGLRSSIKSATSQRHWRWHFGAAEALPTMINKQVADLAAAVEGVKDGATILVGGFGSVGQPDELLDSLLVQGARDLTMVANNAGTGISRGLAGLIAAGRVRKVICSYPRSGDPPRAFDEAYRAGRIELELLPQGTLSERMRCAAAGLGGFYSPVSVGTKLAVDKEWREIDGKRYVLEKPLKGDVAVIKALTADRWGNLVYRKSARNFNPVMAMAAGLTIAQVKEIVELGGIDPDGVHTPGIFVDRIVVV
jgi:3-oxoadipate CoA-transferase, alpha subunit